MKQYCNFLIHVNINIYFEQPGLTVQTQYASDYVSIILKFF